MKKISLQARLFVLLQHVAPQQLISRVIGYFAQSKTIWFKQAIIKRFIEQYEVNLAESEINDINQFESFNDFFTRALKPNARSIDNDAKSITSPADGSISQMGQIHVDQILQAKGRSYSLQTLLAEDEDLTKEFINGSFATIYLAPKDYHRVHMPLNGTLRKTIYVPGDLYSVNGNTAEQVHNLFARNERLVCIFDTESGPMAMILVGAMIVAGIETVWGGTAKPDAKQPFETRFKPSKPKPVKLNKGDEMGRFYLGSTVVLLFPEQYAAWEDELEAGDDLRMGQAIGKLNN